METAQAIAFGKRHWFYLLLPLWVLASVNLHFSFEWTAQPRAGELATLFDWVVFVPALYALCYRGTLSGRALAIRLLAFACSGVWIAGKVVPDPAEGLLLQWGWLRGVGVTALVAVEGLAMLAVLRVAFSANPDPLELERQGIPPIVAKMMLAEARFWRWIWGKLHG